MHLNSYYEFLWDFFAWQKRDGEFVFLNGYFLNQLTKYYLENTRKEK